MKKAKIYIPNKSAMQSGLGTNEKKEGKLLYKLVSIDKWILEFETKEVHGYHQSFNGMVFAKVLLTHFLN